ncbi:beta/gamma crystallin-related protein [Shimazuella soli]|uniref:beta/gamma crystallin-related protein n=1 Tax=Shimazuella soli TaxID=1892854 RepID=UPI003B838CDA
MTLYEHVHFKGRSKKFCSNDKSLVNDGWNDRASSAKVSSGDGVIVYEHTNYKGEKFTMGPGGYGDLTKWHFSIYTSDPKSKRTWNDVISSLRIK